MATNLRGVMAALLTPFDQQQALDKASLRRLVQFTYRKLKNQSIPLSTPYAT